MWLGLTWARLLIWSNVLASDNLWLYLVFKIKAPTLLSLQAWMSMFKCHSRLFSNQYSIYVHLITKIILVSPKLLVRHLRPIYETLWNTCRPPYLEEQQVLQGDFPWTGRTLGLCRSPLSLSLSPRARLQKTIWFHPDTISLSCPFLTVKGKRPLLKGRFGSQVNWITLWKRLTLLCLEQKWREQRS